MSLAAVCGGYYAQKRGAEESGTWREEVAGQFSALLERTPGLEPWGPPGGKVISAFGVGRAPPVVEPPCV